MPDTERMVLRRANWPDIDDVVAMAGDAEVMRHHGDGEPLTAARVLAVEMPRLMADVSRRDQLGCWVARDRVTGGFIGWFTLTPVDDAARTVALGYRLRRHTWGRGYGIEGSRRMLEMARAAHVSTVIAKTSAGDAAGRRVMEGAGLRQVSHVGAAPSALSPGMPGDVDYRLDLEVQEGHLDAAGPTFGPEFGPDPTMMAGAVDVTPSGSVHHTPGLIGSARAEVGTV